MPALEFTTRAGDLQGASARARAHAAESRLLLAAARDRDREAGRVQRGSYGIYGRRR